MQNNLAKNTKKCIVIDFAFENRNKHCSLSFIYNTQMIQILQIKTNLY